MKKGLRWHCAAVHLCEAYDSSSSVNKVNLDCTGNLSFFATLEIVLVSSTGTGGFTASFSPCYVISFLFHRSSLLDIY